MQVEEMQHEEVVETPEVELEAVENEADDVESQEDDEVVVSIGDEKPEEETEEVQQAPTWVKDLRKSSREKDKRIKELERELQAKAAPEPEKPKLGPRPTLEEFGYDEEKHSAATDAWYDKKHQVDAVEAQAKAEQEKAQQEWQGKLASYGKAKAELKVRDFDDAEDVARETLSVVQQGIILQGAENPALVVYALGKSPAKAKELSAITDPVKYAFAIAKLESQLKVSPRKAPPPERLASSGSAAISGSVDSNLERLRNEAAKTGDYSKVIAYKNAQKRK